VVPALVGFVDTPNPITCEGTRVWTYRYTACDPTITADWTFTYTIDLTTPLVAPSNGNLTVECLAAATDPGAPATIKDACDRDVVPALVGFVDTPNPITCEGTRVWTYRYTACDPTITADWTFTYTVTYEDFTVVPSTGGSTVYCPDDTDVPPTPPTVYDNCNVLLTPQLTSVSPKPACDGTRIYVYTYTDCANHSHTYTYTYTVLKGTLTGTLKYYGNNTPLNNVDMKLFDLGFNEIAAYNTDDVTGNFSFPNLCPGDYYLVITNINKPVGYINSTDASAVNSWFVGQGLIEKVKWMSGDVNNSYLTNSTDARAIQNYFVYPGNPAYAFTRGTNDPLNGLYPNGWTFWKADDFVNNNSSGLADDYFTVNVCGNQNIVVYGMAVGDFNASFIPGNAKAASETLSLVYNETRQADASAEVVLPVTIRNSEIVSAVSLIMNFPAEHMTVTGVNMERNNGQLDWSANGNELRIGWSTSDPLWFSSDETLLTISLKTSDTFGQGDEIYFTLAGDPLNELADGNAKVIPDAVLGIDALVFSTWGIPDPDNSSPLTLECRPNPFSTFTTLTYSLPTDGHVTLKIDDMLGRRVAMLADEIQLSGKYSVKLDALPLQPGVYTATITLHTSNGDMVKTIRIVRAW